MLFGSINIFVSIGLWNENTFKESRRKAEESLENAMKSFQCTKTKRLFIVDDIMYLRSMRKEIFNLCRSFNVLMCVVWLNVSLEFAMQNNSQRPSNEFINERSLHKIYNDFQPPSTNIVHDRLFHTVVLSSDHIK